MANRTQKAAMKKRAAAEKVAKAAERAKASNLQKRARAAPGKASTKSGPRKGRSRKEPAPLEFESIPAPVATVAQPSMMERFWQRRAEKAKAREAEAREQEHARLARAAAAQQALDVQSAAAQQRLAAEEARLLDSEREQAKARAADERRQQRQAERAALEENERQAAAAQAERDAEREVAERRKAGHETRRQREAEAAGLEPEMEFQDVPAPVDAKRALVTSHAAPASGVIDAQADLVAAELSRRRSKPVVIVGEEPEMPKLPSTRPAKSSAVPVMAVAAPTIAAAAPTEATGMPIPEAFLLLANEGKWDERMEKNRPGSLGGALAGALLLELLQRRGILVQRDRFTLTGEGSDDAATAAIAARLRSINERGEPPSLQALAHVAKWNRELLEPFKANLAARGMVAYGSRRHLGLFHRSWVELTDSDAQERLRNRMRRAIAGGGTPEASSILLLGLMDAAGLLSDIVPEEALDYNRKRLNGLLGGRDIMGYKVDPHLKSLQEIAVRTILQDVRIMTVRG